MGKEFKNIDELFQSELGGQEAVNVPDRVKTTIDRSIKTKGFGTWLFLGTLVLVVGIAIPIVLFNNSTGVKVTQPTAPLIDLSEFDLTATPKQGYFAYNAPAEKNHNHSKQIPLQANKAKQGSEIDGYSTKNGITTNPQPIDRKVPSNKTIFKTEQNGSITAEASKRTTKQTQLQNEPEITTNKPANDKKAVATTSTLTVIPVKNTTKAPKTALPNDPNGTKATTTNTNAAVTTTEASITETADTNDLAENGTEKMTEPTVKQNATQNKGEVSTLDSESSTISNTTADEPSTTVISDNDSLGVKSIPPIDETAEELAPNETDSTVTTTPIDTEPLPTYRPWMLSATGGINSTKSTYITQNPAEQSVFDSGIQDQLGYQWNMNVSYRLKKGLFFGTGFGVQQFSERYSFSTTAQNISSTTTTVFTPFNLTDFIVLDTMPTGDTNTFFVDFPTDSSTTTTHDTSYTVTAQSGKNHLRYFSIPVFVGFEFPLKRFQFDIMASARFNFLTNASGAYYSDNKIINYSTADESIYKKFYTDLTVATAIHYRVYRSIYLTGTVQFRPTIGSALKSDDFDKTFTSTQVGLGLSIRL